MKLVILAILLLVPSDSWAKKADSLEVKGVLTPWDCVVSRGKLSLSLVSLNATAGKSNHSDTLTGRHLDSIFAFVEESSLLLVNDREIIIDKLMNLVKLQQENALTPSLDVKRAMFLLQSLFILHFQLEEEGYSGSRVWLKNAGDLYANLNALNFTTSSSGSSLVQISKILAMIPPLLSMEAIKLVPDQEGPVGDIIPENVTPQDVMIEVVTTESVTIGSVKIETVTTEVIATEAVIPESTIVENTTTAVVDEDSFVIKPQHIFFTICLSIMILFIYLLRGLISDGDKGGEKSIAKTLDPLMTGDMALKSGDFSRAAREFTALVTKGSEGSESVTGDLVHEAEARLCLAYIWLEDFESLTFLVPKLNCGKIYDRTLVTLIDRLCEAKQFILASQICSKVMIEEIDPAHFKPLCEKLRVAMDRSNSKSMASAFSGSYSDFHRIHKGREAILYRVTKDSTGAELVLKIFDEKLFSGDDKELLIQKFNQYFSVLSAAKTTEDCEISGFGVEPFPYITMNFVVGEPLDLFLKTPVSNDGKRFCSILSLIAASLIKLHNKGLCHGFLETKSIIISHVGKPVVRGYGLCHDSYGGASENRQHEDIKALGQVCLEMVTGLSLTELEKVNCYSGDMAGLLANVSVRLESKDGSISVSKLCRFGLACISFDGSQTLNNLIKIIETESQ